MLITLMFLFCGISRISLYIKVPQTLREHTTTFNIFEYGKLYFYVGGRDFWLSLVVTMNVILKNVTHFPPTQRSLHATHVVCKK